MTEGRMVEELKPDELDAAVATEVMGWYAEYHAKDKEWWTDEDGNRVRRQKDWSPSTNIDHARMVEERLQEQGWHLSLESRVAVLSEAERASGPPWIVRCVDSDTGEQIREGGETAPQAISRAALRVA